MATDFITLAPVYNGDSVPLTAGMITRLKVGANNNVVRAQANSAPNVQGVNGVVLSGYSALGGLVTLSSVGRTSVQMEGGLTLAVGQTVYVSPNVAGKGTNVQPVNVATVGVIADVSNYVALGTVVIDVIVGAGGSSGGGAQGAQGATGTAGAAGAAGAQGAQGAIGAGAQGAQGFQGAQGATGTQGFQGAAGAGAQGAQGFQGAVGVQGFQGAQGFQGSAAAVLAAVTVVAVANIALTGALTIDGVAVPNGARVLAAAQSTPSQNGVYIANTGGAWARSSDFSSAGQMIAGTLIPVLSGTLFAGSVWEFVTTGAITVGTTPLSFLQVGPPTFGSDTVVQLPNASAVLVKALELIASLTVNTPGAEVSQWVIDLLSAGVQVSSYVLGVLGITVPNGSAATPSVNFAGSTNSGIYRQGADDNRLVSGGTGIVKWFSSGIQLLVTAGIIQWANGVGMAQGGFANRNLNLTGDATNNGDIVIGKLVANATNATNGFISMPTCAGTPTGTPDNLPAGKVQWVYDTTANKIWVFNGSWRATGALS